MHESLVNTIDASQEDSGYDHGNDVNPLRFWMESLLQPASTDKLVEGHATAVRYLNVHRITDFVEITCQWPVA
jgi:hypothetical protein